MKQRPIDAYALAGVLCKYVGQTITLEDVLHDVASAPTVELKTTEPAAEKPTAKKGAKKK